MTGRRYARVFPLPVAAANATELEDKRAGIASSWIGVGESRLARDRPSFRSSIKPKPLHPPALAPVEESSAELEGAEKGCGSERSEATSKRL